jgi:hypothetical protein
MESSQKIDFERDFRPKAEEVSEGRLTGFDALVETIKYPFELLDQAAEPAARWIGEKLGTWAEEAWRRDKPAELTRKEREDRIAAEQSGVEDRYFAQQRLQEVEEGLEETSVTIVREGSEQVTKIVITQAVVGGVFALASKGKGAVSGVNELRKKARAGKLGDAAAAAEIRAAKALRKEGLNVHFRTPKSEVPGGGPGRTSDFLVGGQAGTGAGGTAFEVFSPTTSSSSRVVSEVAKKLKQADRFVIDLSRSSLTKDDLANILSRVNNIPNISRPLKEVIFLEGENIVAHVF